MKSIKTLVLLGLLVIISVSCDKKDDNGVVAVPVQERGAQYAIDIVKMEDYLKSHYMTVNANIDVTVTKIPVGGTQTSIWDQTVYPLQNMIVKNDGRATLFTDGRIADDVDYKMYYIILNEGGGERPNTIDSSFVDYKGWNMENVEIDRTSTPIWTSFPGAAEFISGFRQMLPKIKTAQSYTVNGDGSINYSNYGNCVVFIPSGLAYFSNSRVNIPNYANLMFQIKLKALRYNDHDQDKILTKYELTGTQTDFFLQDTDGDKIPDFLDINDDGDLYLTKNELKKPDNSYYQFNDVPDCSGNTTNPIRLKKHLDPSCHL